MTNVYFVYPHGPSISAPDAIGRNVAARLEQDYRLVQCDWDDRRVCRPEPGDVLVGHPHPDRHTVFRQSVAQHGWRRIILLAPYTHDPRQVAFLDPLVSRCDLFLAITGNHWFDSVEESRFSHWHPKMVHVDLAVDRADYPVIKRSFNPVGSRKFLYIGHNGWQKNPRYLSQIARAMPETSIAWVGLGARIEGLTRLGPKDFTTDASRRLVASHDFLLTVGEWDANPSTILEAMAWGLVPVCTPTSGYNGYEGIVNVPLNDPAEAVAILERLQQAPEPDLESAQRENWKALDSHFNWDRFADQVVEAIESDRSPALTSPSHRRVLRNRIAAALAQNHRSNRFARTVRKLSRGFRRVFR